MKDICVYTTPEVFHHKSMDGHVYWLLKNLPKNRDELEICGRIYFAVEGFIIGYFKIENINEADNAIEWHSQSWEHVGPIPQRPFQGFKYLERGTV